VSGKTYDEWYIYYTVSVLMLYLRFAFDELKSSENLRKHGIDFLEAQKLWLDPDRVEIAARYVGEIRLIVIGRVEGRHWAAVVTPRGELIRMISVRRARVKEVEIYDR